MVSAALFEEFEGELNHRLIDLGYVESAREINSSFGSHYAEFQNRKTVYRLVWDGRESWLVLARATVLPDEEPKWHDVSLQRFPSLATPRNGILAAFHTICEALERELNESEP